MDHIALLSLGAIMPPEGGRMRRLLLVGIAVLFASSMVWAEDGAAIYKSKCAMCHGAAGEGKAAPKIAGTADTKVSDVLTKGGQAKPPHTKAMAGLTDDQVKAVASYVASLK